MKRFFKVVLPVVLAVSILLCTAWYFLVYDHEFTQDVLLYCANFFEDQGQHKFASWLYDLSYRQTDNHDDIAVRLAEKYIDNGNFTKAEHTLFRAISEGGGKDLYIALSKVFLAQDKLLDAVKLLDNITDPALKAELDALRPAAPELSPTPGYYNQRITVTVANSNVTYYIAADGEYPSLKEDLYTKPIALDAGESTIYALSVADNGLVSPLTVATYTIVGVVEKVNFADSAMEAEIRKILSAPASQVLYTNDLWQIKSFTIPADVQSLDDLKYLTHLEQLTVSHDVAGKLANLSVLLELEELSITNSSVTNSDLSIIGALPKLTKLTLKNCNISSLSGLENAKQLTYLDLSFNAIRNIGPLAYLTKLQELNLSNNALENLDALTGLVLLAKLDIANNAVTSISNIMGLTCLTELKAAHNRISDIAVIGGFAKLEILDLSYNQIAVVSFLANNKELTYLDISNNSVTDINWLSALVKLHTFRFSNNKITKLPTWPADCALVILDGAYNQITSIAPLKGLNNINNIYLDYNPNLSSLSGLENCHNLIMVSVFGTKVRNASALIQQSIIVHYDPT